MDISIIIVTRNTCDLTRNAVTSVMESSTGISAEVWIVDNGSTDETAKVLPREFPGIRLLRSERNLGFSKAVNLAARQATGQFLLLLNSDARPAPDALHSALSWMRQNPDCGVSGARLLHNDGSSQNSIANFPSLATELLNKSLLRRLWPNRFPGKEFQPEKPLDVDTVIGAFMLIRKSIWDRLGGLDERFFFFFEETDFCLQVRNQGFRVTHLPEVRVWHGQGQTAKQVSIGVRIEHWRSRYAYFAKNSGRLVRLLLLGGLLVRLTIDLAAALALTLATGGTNLRWRTRLKLCSALAGWHLRGCPRTAGLPR